MSIEDVVIGPSEMDLTNPVVQARLLGRAITLSKNALGLADIPGEPLDGLLDRILRSALRGGLEPGLYQVCWLVRSMGLSTMH